MQSLQCDACFFEESELQIMRNLEVTMVVLFTDCDNLAYGSDDRKTARGSWLSAAGCGVACF